MFPELLRFFSGTKKVIVRTERTKSWDEKHIAVSETSKREWGCKNKGSCMVLTGYVSSCTVPFGISWFGIDLDLFFTGFWGCSPMDFQHRFNHDTPGPKPLQRGEGSSAAVVNYSKRDGRISMNLGQWSCYFSVYMYIYIYTSQSDLMKSLYFRCAFFFQTLPKSLRFTCSPQVCLGLVNWLRTQLQARSTPGPSYLVAPGWNLFHRYHPLPGRPGWVVSGHPRQPRQQLCTRLRSRSP